MRTLGNLRRTYLLYGCLFGLAVIAAVVLLAQHFGASAGLGVAEQMGRIGQAGVRTETLPTGSVVAHQGEAVALLETVQVVQAPRDSTSGLIYVRGRWRSGETRSRFTNDTMVVGIVAQPAEPGHPWKIRLEARSSKDLLLVGIMRLYPGSSSFALYGIPDF